MADVTIYVGSTAIWLHCDKYGNVAPGISVAGFVQAHLQVKDWVQTTPGYNANGPTNRTYQVVANFTYRDEASEMAYFPRYSLDALLTYFEGLNVAVQHVEPYPTRDVKMSLKRRVEPREHQIPMIDYLLSPGNVKLLNVPTSVGKTFMAIYTMVKLGNPAIVILPGLIAQWYKSIRQFTNLTTKELFIIKGVDSLKRLWELVGTRQQPKIVLASMRTMALYALESKDTYDGIPSYQELQKKMGIGTIVYDECHMWFQTSLRMQLTANVAHNIFLSATFARTHHKEDDIFNMVYPKNLRYTADPDKYTDVVMYQYQLGIPMETANRLTIPNIGYSHIRYEKYLMRNPKYYDYWFEKVLVPIIWSDFLNLRDKDEKLLILNWTRDFSKKITNDLRSEFPDLKINYYFSGQVKESVLQSSEIIVSTHKSCGTGVDIKGLRSAINTVSFASQPLAVQVMGRLRPIPGKITHFADMYNVEVGAQSWHAIKRQGQYKTRAHKYQEIKLL